ncbi:hypothetical protein AB0I60_29920 [Actinosynnema sp. NPDC050436]|uniref:hypothetical protein n=1 Tax=Actinosynnema sp. NPDC050436 TaxID=3155659 RepID=UPI003408F1EA
MEQGASRREPDPYEDYGLHRHTSAKTDQELLDQVARDQGLDGPLARLLTELLHAGEVDDVLDHQALRLGEGVPTRSAPPDPGAYYPGIPHQELYESVHTEVDPGRVGEMGSAWTTLGNALTGFTESIAKAIADSEEDWVGTSGDGARQALADLGNRAGRTGVSAQLAGTLFAQQSRALSDARNSVPPPPSPAFSVQEANDRLLRITDPLEVVRQAAADRAAFEQQQEDHREAARVVQTYDRTVAQTAAAQPAFAPPPAVPEEARTDGETPVGTRGTSSRRVAAVPEVPGTSDTTGTSGTTAPVARTGPPGAEPPGVGGVTQPGGTGHGADVTPGRQPAGGVPGVGAVGGLPGVGPAAGRAGAASARTTSLPGGAAAARGGRAGGVPGVGGGGRPGFGGGAPGAGGQGPGGHGPGGHGPGQHGVGHGGSSGVAPPGGQQPAAARGGAATGRGAGGPVGAGGVGGVGGPQREEDVEHHRPSYLVEPDPDGVFGDPTASAPPVIGDWDH